MHINIIKDWLNYTSYYIYKKLHMADETILRGRNFFNSIQFWNDLGWKSKVRWIYIIWRISLKSFHEIKPGVVSIYHPVKLKQN